jgi:hypothetical protein
VVGAAVGLAEVDGKLTQTLAIKIYVEPGHGVRGELPGSFEGYPVNVVERIFFPAVATPARPPLDADIPDYWRYDPLVGGICIAPCEGGVVSLDIGTLGAVVIDKESGGPMLLSNFHVMAVDKNWTVGTNISQPWEPFCTEHVATLSRAKLTETVDAAVAIQTARGFFWDILDIGPINGTVAAQVDMKVKKHGITTRLTYGTISALNLEARMFVAGEWHVFKNQIEIHPDTDKNQNFMDHGDSGSVIVDESGRALGLGFAVAESGGVAIANHIDEVTKALNIAIPSSNEFPSIKNKTIHPETTNAPPVLVSASGRSPLLLWSGATDQKINIATLDGQSLSDKTTLGQRAYRGLAFAPAPTDSNGLDYLAWTGTDDQLNLAALDLYQVIQEHTLLKLYSPMGPALARINEKLVLAWVGTDQRLNIAVSTDGGKTFPNPLKTGMITASAPSLTNINGTIYLCTHAPGSWPWFTRVTFDPLIVHMPIVIAQEPCTAAPSVESSGQFVAVFRAKDRNAIKACTSRDGIVFSNAVTFPANTAFRPSLCFALEKPYMVWAEVTSFRHRAIVTAELSFPTG